MARGFRTSQIDREWRTSSDSWGVVCKSRVVELVGSVEVSCMSRMLVNSV